MDIVGKNVTHIKFGKGKITGLHSNKVEVDFNTVVRRFIYPESFEHFFKISDKEAEKFINSELDEINETKRKKMQQKIIKPYQNAAKVKANSQAMFSLKEEELLQVFETWEISTGHYAQGSKKGMVRIPSNIEMNSACVITTKKSGKKEFERTVSGIFMVQDGFCGRQCKTGNIIAHEKYRILCDPDEDIYIWDYFPEDKRLKTWGSGKMKYISGFIVKKIIQHMIVKGTDEGQKEELQNFYNYFCDVNHI